MESDPIGLDGGINTYAYADNSPVALFDFYGLETGKLPGTDIFYRIDWNQHPKPNMHVYWSDGKESVITDKGGWQATHGGKKKALPPKKYRKALRKVVGDFVKRAGKKISGFTCPPLLEDVVYRIVEEQCAGGDINACAMYLNLGGDSLGPIT